MVLHVNNSPIIFDQKMTWRFHIEALGRKYIPFAGKQIKKTFLNLHRSLLLSKLNYGCHIYSSTLPSVLSKLDLLHHQGLQLATGAFRWTPVRSFYVETGFAALLD